MNRADFLQSIAAAVVAPTVHPSPASVQLSPDYTIRISAITLELSPTIAVRTFGYNGSVPGPMLRLREGSPVTVRVINETDHPELLHWHGQMVSPAVDGAIQEGTPPIPAHGERAYRFTPKPGGTRFYHTHAFAGSNLTRSSYSGQFGFAYIEPGNDSGNYDREVFLAMHDWEGSFVAGGMEEKQDAMFVTPAGTPDALARKQEENSGLEVSYKYFSINGRMLGYADPIRVRHGERVMFRILNASATENRRMALAGHRFRIIALDGNPVPNPKEVETLELGPAERVDAIVTMNNPGVWIFGTTFDEDRSAGMGIVLEYANARGEPAWRKPGRADWDYSRFGSASALHPEPERTFTLEIRKAARGKNAINSWTINGKSFPHTEDLHVRQGRRYRLVFANRSDDAHPMHVHRHTFELTNLYGKPTAGVMKDVVLVRPYGTVAVDFIADDPGLTLMHCHQQLHMDYGFMQLIRYV